MAPDDLPVDRPADDSTGSSGPLPRPGKPGKPGKPSQPGIGPEAEVRGGGEEPDETPIEQQQRRDRVKP
ncbi:MAG: hypothetical protein HIU92_09595 [Proteobacteria bacterium]|nr:hypothetical protein [Pseudomonadota bacterium]